MTTFNWSSLANGQAIAFNPVADLLYFDDPLFSAPTVAFDYFSSPGTTTFIGGFDGKTVTLLTAPGTLTSGNVVFASGSMLLYGDNTTGTANDDQPNTLAGSTGDDALYGAGGADTLSGGDGIDLLDGGNGDDSLAGGPGRDVFADLYGNNTLSGGQGDDFFILIALGGGSVITGGAGSDVFYAGIPIPFFPTSFQVQDFQTGAGGDELNFSVSLTFSALSGYYQGGDPVALGFIQISQSGADILASYDNDGAAEFSFTPLTVVTLKNVLPSALTAENLTGYVIGGIGDDALFGDESDQFLYAAEGSDTLDGAQGADTMFGGSGGDIYFVDNLEDSVVETSNAPAGAEPPPGAQAAIAPIAGITDTVIASINYALENFVENLTLTGGATSGTGNALNNDLVGNALANTLVGLEGDDSILGAAGNEHLRREHPVRFRHGELLLRRRRHCRRRAADRRGRAGRADRRG